MTIRYVTIHRFAEMSGYTENACVQSCVTACGAKGKNGLRPRTDAS